MFRIKTPAPIVKLLLSIIILTVFAYFLWWLWQRQPKPKTAQNPTVASSEAKVTKENNSQESIVAKPQDNSALAAKVTSFEGTTDPEFQVLIFSNGFQEVTKANSDGKFQKEITLSAGLNLVDVIIVNKDFTEGAKQTLTLWVLDEKSKGEKDAKFVYAGSVKSIFENIITISNSNGDKTIRSTESTIFDLPKNPDSREKESSQSAQSVRVGDYLIALSNQNGNDTATAKKIIIIRDDKPQNNKKIILAKILTGVRQNLFSVKNEKDGKIIELTQDKNSKISKNGQKASETEIVKEKRAIILYHSLNNEKIADLVYLTL